MVIDKSQIIAYFKGSSGRLFTYAIALIILNIVVSFTLICSLSGEKYDLTGASLTLQGSLKDSQSDEGRLGALRAKNAKVSIKEFKETLPSEQGLTKVLSDINKKAKKNGLGFKAGSYSPSVVPNSNINKYSISFTVSGEYGKVKRFLYDLETLKHLLVVEDVTLSKGSVMQVGTALTISVSTYYL